MGERTQGERTQGEHVIRVNVPDTFITGACVAYLLKKKKKLQKRPNVKFEIKSMISMTKGRQDCHWLKQH